MPPERIPIEWIGIRSTSLASAHVLIGKPVSTFPEHAPSVVDLHASRTDTHWNTWPKSRRGRAFASAAASKSLADPSKTCVGPNKQIGREEREGRDQGSARGGGGGAAGGGTGKRGAIRKC